MNRFRLKTFIGNAATTAAVAVIAVLLILFFAGKKDDTDKKVGDTDAVVKGVETSTPVADLDSELPDADEFEQLLNKAIKAWYGDNYKSEYAVRNYKDTETTDPNAAYDSMITATYGPGTGFGLMGGVTEGKVVYAFTFIAIAGADLDGDSLAAAGTFAAVTAMVFSDDYNTTADLSKLLLNIMENGTKEQDDDSINTTLSIDGIEYSQTISTAMLGFSVDARDKLSAGGKNQTQATDSDASFGQGVTSSGISQLDITEILSGRMSFVDFETKKTANIETLQEINYNYGGVACRFTVIDIDRDGGNELIIEYNRGGELAIIKNFDNKLTAFYASPREMINLKTDGTMSWSSSAFESGVGYIKFTSNGMEQVEIIGYDTTLNVFTVEGKRVTKAECDKELAKQRKKADVSWTELFEGESGGIGGAMSEHEHSFAGQWKSIDASSHYKMCDCGEQKKEAHSFDGGKVTKASTHTSEGQKTFTCKDCGYTNNEMIAADVDSHSFGAWKDSGDGKNHMRSCYCGKTETKKHRLDGGSITKEATHFSDGEKTIKCADCGYSKIETIAKTDEHEFGNWSKVDCTTHVRYCDCGESEMAAHSADSVLYKQEPTYNYSGYIIYLCNDCGSDYSEEIPKLDAPNGGSSQIGTRIEHPQLRCNYCGHDDGTIQMEVENGVKYDVKWTCSACGKQNWNYVTYTW